MEFFAPGTKIDFMRIRRPIIALSLMGMALGIVSWFAPGPNFGIDFSGGTELQLAFQGKIAGGEVRKALESLGYKRPDVVAVAGKSNEYIIRVSEVSALGDAEKKKVEAALPGKLPTAFPADPAKRADGSLQAVTWSPGGDKLSLDLDAPVATDELTSILASLGVRVRSVAQFGKEQDYRYEAQLVGVADKLVASLKEKLSDRGPGDPLRVEWVGPKAGAQLRDAAIQSLLYSIVFIMVYVAFRFDLRFAPGGVVALLHDALLTVAFVVFTRLEFNLQTVAAILTIVGYSINDTIVVFDRIRENMGRLKDHSLLDLINLSTSQTLSRTIITSGTTVLSLVALVYWGTPVIRDLAITLIFGIGVGTYSSIYIAAPVTEWMDKRFYNKAAAAR